MEGIAKAKLAGKYNGRPATVDNQAIVEMHRQGWKTIEIMKAQGVESIIGRARNSGRRECVSLLWASLIRASANASQSLVL